MVPAQESLLISQATGVTVATVILVVEAAISAVAVAAETLVAARFNAGFGHRRPGVGSPVFFLTEIPFFSSMSAF